MRDLWNRWLGLGLATLLGAATLVLTVTDRLSLYVNPASSWFAIAMAVVAVAVGVIGFALPRGAEHAHHDHDHGHDVGAHEREGISADHVERADRSVLRSLAPVATATGGTLASVVVLAAWALPPTTLSVDIAINRSSETPALFGGEETVALAQSGDTTAFGIPEWSTVFASTTSPETFSGDRVELVGFVMEDPDVPERFLLTRLVITHCAIDAQPASIPVMHPGWRDELEVGAWVELTGAIALDDGTLAVDPSSLTEVTEPEDPYEY